MPTPLELLDLTFAGANAWRDRFAAVPFEDRGGYFQGRNYQDLASERVLAAITNGRTRILLTLATGTGKTFIAFQVAWKLFSSRWNLADWKSEGEPARRPRILFLADRNILADQACNAFSAFPDDALVHIAPADIRKKARVPKNGSLFFTIFQTFTGRARPDQSGGEGVRPGPTRRGTGQGEADAAAAAEIPQFIDGRHRGPGQPGADQRLLRRFPALALYRSGGLTGVGASRLRFFNLKSTDEHR